MTSTVGRAGELARALEQLSMQPAGSVLFVGAAGIGKSTVLAATVEKAGSLGLEVRRSRAAASEEDLPFVGLHDLIGDALGEAPASLPEPLRRALEVVLLRAAPPEGGLDVLAVNVAVLELLTAMSSKHRLMLVLDDVQWLDRPTHRTLEFALRRLPAGAVAVVAAAREVDPQIEALMPEPPVVIEIGPLSKREIADLVELRTGLVLSPQRVADLHLLSGGNPFLALELARGPSSTVRGLEQLAVPERHLQVLGPRLAAMSSDARRAVLAAALSSRPTPALLIDVAGAAGLANAESASVLRVTGDRVEFDHPLLAAAARQEAGVVTQREMHLALASASDDQLERSRHLALGTVGEDARLADELEAAAAVAADRAAVGIAADLARYSLERTPLSAVADRVRRAVAAARWLDQSAERPDAREVIAPVLEATAPGPLRGRCLVGMAVAMGQDIAAALDLLGEALVQPDLDLDVVLEARMLRASALFVTGDLEGSRAEAARAGAAAREAGATEISSVIAMLEAQADLCLGVPLERSPAWARTQPWPSGRSAYEHPDRLLGYVALGRDDPQEARRLFEGLIRLAQERGDVGSESGLSMHLAEVAIREGRLPEAAEWAERCWHGLRDHSALYIRALVAAWTGDLANARKSAGVCLATAVAAGDVLFEAQALFVLGLTEVSAGRLQQASQYESRIRDIVAKAGWRQPGLTRWQSDAVEAFLGAGQVQEAAEVTAELWSQADQLDLPGCKGVAAHCDGLIQAHEGDLKLAEDHLERALALMAGLDMPLERARTLLALGVVRRRRRQKAAARDALTQAQDIFTRAGATVWAGRVDEELRRSSAGRSGDELSAGERSVAELAAAGRTNREIATQLYLSPKTVETVLTHVYRKLGVRSRTELSRSWGAGGSSQGMTGG